jgi:ribosomal protein L22
VHQRCEISLQKGGTMKTLFRILVIVVYFLVTSSTLLYSADFLGDALKKGLPQLPELGGSPTGRATGAGLDDSTIASGLKDALSVGTKNAVSLVSKLNGYYGNEAIRILLPDKIQKAAELAGNLGYQKQVDDFILSMNRAAEKAAPKAASHFADTIKGMSIEDARKILSGGDTAATEYFKSKTFSKLYDEFKPSVSQSINQVGVTRAYNDMMGKIPSIPFAKPESVDLNHYVTTKALDGIFYMVGQEEQKIRTNPMAQTTDLLKKVFGK